MDDTAIEIPTDELREFLDADRRVVHVDPDFKERLRRKLWAIVRSRDGQFGGGDDER